MLGLASLQATYAQVYIDLGYSSFERSKIWHGTRDSNRGILEMSWQSRRTASPAYAIRRIDGSAARWTWMAGPDVPRQTFAMTSLIAAAHNLGLIYLCTDGVW